MPWHAFTPCKIALLCCALLCSGLVRAEGWQLDMDKDGIQLYTQASENSPLKQVKVVTRLQASLSSLVAFLSDYSAFPQWMDKISKVEKLKDISERETITYTVVDAPWPERDRDSVLYSRWEQNPQTLVVTKQVYSEPQHLSEDSNKIRSPAFEAQWVLTPKGGDEVEVAYISDYDPGGNVQGWLLDVFTYEMPFSTIKNLRAATLKEYEGREIAFIKEPTTKGVVMAQ